MEHNQGEVYVPALGVREKLIAIFLLAKVLPLILLAYIAWVSLVSLGTTLRETATVDAQTALSRLARENIERVSTDAAQKVAEFLYQRDADISFLAKQVSVYFNDEEKIDSGVQSLLRNFSNQKTSLIRQHSDWEVSREDGMSWVQTNPYIPPVETKERSVNKENSNEHSGITFNYRPPYGFGDDAKRFKSVSIYDEIAVLDMNGMQIAKYIPSQSAKKRHTFPKNLVDVSDPNNTFVKAERYFEELQKLEKDKIYVSDVIGAYVPTQFIGMYTPNSLASKRIDAKIAELKGDETQNHDEAIWKLQVLNAELKNEETKFNSSLEINKEIRNQIDVRLGKGQTWKISTKSLRQVAEELKTLGLNALAEEITNLSFKPEEQAFAGAENPQGVRFEGIIRWGQPILDDNNEVKGYVTFALNHDHLMEMIDHITPMPERYAELSDAHAGNYAFVWDYQCRSIVHPRHHSICGYNPETGMPETPWLEKTLYDGMIAAGYDRADWQKYIATLNDYVPWTGDENSLAFQSRSKKPALELSKEGMVGLDGRYLNFAPQCTGWMDLAKDGGSGSLYILWSGLYKLNTASAIPYYTGQYSPEVRGNRCGFGFVAIGAGVDDFSQPAHDMGFVLEDMVNNNIRYTTSHLFWTTVILSIIVIFIAIWMASYLSRKLQWLIDGISRFCSGKRDFRFSTNVYDEFGRLAHSFDSMADNIVNSIHSPLVITNMNLEILYLNDHSMELIGVKRPEDVVGQSYKEWSIYPFGSEYCPITALHLGSERTKVMYQKRAGKFFQGSANFFTDDQGETLGYIVSSIDVTELSRKQIELQRAKEEAELASKHKSRFFARMSHELRTPMNAIIGFNNITQSQISSVRTQDDLIEINNSLACLKDASDDLLLLLNDILEVSNFESGSVQLFEKPVNLCSMLLEITEKVKQDCVNKQLEFVTHIDELMPKHFVTDGPRIQHILLNLLSNAVKYTPPQGRVDFTVQKIDQNDSKTLLLFAVRDTGIGISPSETKRIFSLFDQVGVSENNYSHGCGLGLTIVRRSLELLNTEIQVQSELGKGSEFSFDIWLQECDVEDESCQSAVGLSFAGKKTLVVDDVRLNRIVLCNLLKESGLVVDEAKDGKEALEMFAQSPENGYDLILMDIQMPIMNGWDAATAIRQLPRLDAATVPIVTISANAFKEDVDKSLASGMNAHYAKPVHRETVDKILLKFVKPQDYVKPHG